MQNNYKLLDTSPQWLKIVKELENIYTTANIP